MAHLCAARLRQLEKIIQKFPNISKGVLVEEVIEGSPAGRAGILEGDVIVRCAGKDVGGFFGVLWHDMGQEERICQAGCDKINKWCPFEAKGEA